MAKRQLTIIEEARLNEIVAKGVKDTMRWWYGGEFTRDIVAARLSAQYRKNALANLGFDEDNNNE